MKASISISMIGLAAATAASLCGQSLTVENLPMVREGSYWVRTTPEVNVSSPRSSLRVNTKGHIALRGGDGDRITWRMKQRVSARTEEGARQLLGDIYAVADAIENVTVLTVRSNAPLSRVINELEISVPKRMLSVVLNTAAGGIEAYDIDGDIRIAADSGDLQMDRIGGNVLSARTGGGNIRLGKIVGTVQQCSTGAGWISLDSPSRATACTTAGGDILVREAGGPLNLATEGGNIRVGRAASSVRAISSAGLIDILQAGGSVYADARGGSIIVGSARGIEAASAAGMVRVKAASGPMSVSTAMGNIMAELLAGARLEDSSLVAGSGDITVLIPSNFPVSVIASNASGGTPRIISDFPEIRANSTSFFRSPLLAQGALNGGGPILRLNAGGGVIYLKRVK